MTEAAIVQQAPERLETEATLTDVLVSIDAAAARPLRVVAVKDLQPIEADDAIERGEGVAIAGVGDNVVSRCDEVTRVEADADSWRSIHMVDDRRQMLEAISQRSPLPGRVLEQHHGLAARARLERRADRIRNQLKPSLLCSRGADTRVNDDPEQAKGVSTIEFVDEGRERRRAESGRRSRQVDQIAGVRHDRRDAGLRNAAAEPPNIDWIDRFAEQLARVLGEQLQRLAAVQQRPFDGIGHATGHGHVSTNTHREGLLEHNIRLMARSSMHPARTTVLLALASATLTVVVLFAQGNPEAAKIPNTVAADAASLATGKQVYTRYCAVCHGVNAEGGSGSDISPPAPDLTDKEWKRGGTDGEIFTVIKNGVPQDLAMEPWGDRIKDPDIWNVVNYIRSLAKK